MTLAYNIRTDLLHDGLEAVFIDLFLPKTKPIFSGVCYRPPKDFKFYNMPVEVVSHSSITNAIYLVILIQICLKQVTQ